MDNINLYLDQINKKFLDMEERKTELDEENVKWVTEISSPLFQLIDKTINFLRDPVLNVNQIQEYYYILKKILQIYPQSVTQFKKNGMLPSILVKYISSTPKENISLEAFDIFVKVYEQKIYSGLLQEEFINGLFNSFDVIKDEEVFNRIATVLVDICSLYDDIEANLFLTVYHYHDNSRIIDETVLRLLNNCEKNDENKRVNLLFCISSIMDKEKNCVFYSSDLEVFIDVALNILSNSESFAERLFVLEALERITLYEEYYKDMYKIDLINETLEGMADSDEVEEVIQEKVHNIIEHMSLHLE